MFCYEFVYNRRSTLSTWMKLDTKVEQSKASVCYNLGQNRNVPLDFSRFSIFLKIIELSDRNFSQKSTDTEQFSQLFCLHKKISPPAGKYTRYRGCPGEIERPSFLVVVRALSFAALEYRARLNDYNSADISYTHA